MKPLHGLGIVTSLLTRFRNRTNLYGMKRKMQVMSIFLSLTAFLAGQNIIWACQYKCEKEKSSPCHKTSHKINHKASSIEKTSTTGISYDCATNANSCVIGSELDFVLLKNDLVFAHVEFLPNLIVFNFPVSVAKTSLKFNDERASKSRPIFLLQEKFLI